MDDFDARAQLPHLDRHLEIAPQGGHDALDAMLALAFDDCHDDAGLWVYRPSEIERDQRQVVPTPPYTSSLTDAVWLVEHALPGWCWQVRKLDGYKAAIAPERHRNAANSKGVGGDWVTAYGESAALALLRALVKALPASAGADVKDDEVKT